jgi:hypothetical protein
LSANRATLRVRVSPDGRHEVKLFEGIAPTLPRWEVFQQG